MAITDSINCDCVDSTGYRTLAELRADVYAALGFVDPNDITDSRELSDLRAELFRMLGFAAMGASYPPGMSDLLDDWLNNAQQAIWRRCGFTGAPPAKMVNGSDTNTLDASLVLAMACYLGKAHYGKADAKEWKEIAERDLRFPPGAAAAVDRHLKSANTLIYRRYDSLRTERFFTWDLQAGVALYDFPDNEEGKGTTPQCTKKLDPYKIRWVGIKDFDSAWRPLTQGIPEPMLGYDLSGPPTHFEFRQCIHVWPAPDTTQGQLIVRGHYGPEDFTDDTDTPTVDDELVYLLAVANAKAQFKQPDANLFMSQFEVHLSKLIAGSHGVRRFVPGVRTDADYVYVQPRPEVPFA